MLVHEQKATCINTGCKKYVCSKCKKEKNESIGISEHNYDCAQTIMPTETEDGYDVCKCKECGKEVKQNFRSFRDLTPLEQLSVVKCSSNNYVYSAMPHENNREVLQTVVDRRGNSGLSFLCKLDCDTSSEEMTRTIETGHKLLTCAYSVYVMSVGDTQKIGLLPYASGAENLDLLVKNAERIKEELGIGEETDVLTAITLINQYICDNIVYDYSFSGDPICFLTENKGTCAVYSMNFQIICQTCGIECYYVYDVKDSHAFNYILAPDGTKLYIDTCWNAGPVKRPKQYFLLPYEEFMAKHGWEP